MRRIVSYVKLNSVQHHEAPQHSYSYITNNDVWYSSWSYEITSWQDGTLEVCVRLGMSLSGELPH